MKRQKMEWTNVAQKFPELNGSPYEDEVLVAEFDEKEKCWNYFVGCSHHKENLWVTVAISKEDEGSNCVVTKEIKDNHYWSFIENPLVEQKK